jgi:hypothetical protein
LWQYAMEGVQTYVVDVDIGVGEKHLKSKKVKG